MKTLKFYSLLLLALVLTVGASAQSGDAEKPTIVFVHGVWAMVLAGLTKLQPYKLRVTK
jgi:hypothetical protein